MGLEPVAFRATHTLFVDAINNSATNSPKKTHPSDENQYTVSTIIAEGN